VFDIIAGRYNGNIPNMDVWLKGHSGDMIRVDRKGRPPEYIRKPAMTLGLMIQHEVLKTIAAQPSFRGRGLVARFLYTMPVSNVGYRKTNTDAVPDHVLTAYNTVIRGLAKELQKRNPDDPPHVLKLTPEAMTAIATLEAETELALREGGALANLRDWGGKYVGTIARIAGLLHLVEHGGAKGLKIPVSDTTVWAAADLGTYYKFGAIQAFEVMATDPTIADAVYLLGKLKLHPTDTISERDMQRAARKFHKKTELLAAVEVLVDYGWLQPKTVAQQKGQGRPASPQYKIHPLVKA
jgi:replicative DNA helicase